ncbi:hypothetical protein JCM6882_009503 [Rhodosporidiobolus microsporus]
MIAWLLKLLILFLNLRASHKALRPLDKGKRRATRTGERGGEAKRDSRTAERDRRKRQKEQLANWVVWVCFCLVERVSDRTVGRVLPFYGTFKTIALVTVLLWRGAGSQLIFDKVIKPLVRPYERPIDVFGHILGEILHLSVAAVLFVPSWVVHKWRTRRAEPDVPAILRGLRQPHNPPLAHSLASSIDHANERAKEDAERINARLSQPVQVSLHPFRPVRRSPLPPPPAPLPAREPSPGLPPPPVASTAPFRPVPVALPGSTKTRLPAARPPPTAQPVASTSRLPVPQPTRQPFTPALHPAAAGSAPSLYPSLAGVSSPLQPVDLPPRDAPSASSTRLDGDAPAVAKDARRSSASRTAAAAKGKGKVRPREDSTDTDRERDQGLNGSGKKPPAKRTRTRSSRLSAGSSRAPEREEVEAMDVEPEKTPRSPTPPPLAPPPAPSLPPGTPAPPGAFSFLSPQPASRTSSSPAPATTMQLDDSDVADEPTPKKATPVRRRTRHSLAAAADEEVGDEVTKQADLPGSFSQRSTPRKKASAVSPEAKKAQPLLKETTATPRQKALGAIAQLSKDLFDDDDDFGAGGGLSAKKRKTSVLARTGGGTLKGKERAVEPVKTRRTRAKTVDEDGDEDYIEAEEENGTKRVSPAKKRKAVRAPSVQVEDDDDEDRPSRLKKPAASKSRLASSTSRLSASTSSSARTSRASAVGENGTSTSTSALPRSRSRLAVSTSVSSSSRAASPAPSTTGADESDDALIVSSATGTNGKAKAKAPPRRAKRVLLGRGGSAALEEEEEIEGVSVARVKGAARGVRR